MSKHCSSMSNVIVMRMMAVSGMNDMSRAAMDSLRLDPNVE